MPLFSCPSYFCFHTCRYPNAHIILNSSFLLKIPDSSIYVCSHYRLYATVPSWMVSLQIFYYLKGTHISTDLLQLQCTHTRPNEYHTSGCILLQSGSYACLQPTQGTHIKQMPAPAPRIEEKRRESARALTSTVTVGQHQCKCVSLSSVTTRVYSSTGLGGS